MYTLGFGKKSLVLVTMTRVFSSNSLTRDRERERERIPNQWNSATSKQKNKKEKNSVARRIKRKEEQIEAKLNEDQRRVASKQRRML